MAVFLINPSDHSFGTAVITPRWLYVLAGATPTSFGDPVIIDETLEALDPEGITAGDLVGIGIHTGNALRGYEVGRLARERGGPDQHPDFDVPVLRRLREIRRGDEDFPSVNHDALRVQGHRAFGGRQGTAVVI